MPSPLRLLILEDRPTDAELMLVELRRAGFAADWRRVETEADFVAALNPSLDLILSDYSLPQFNGLRALQLLQERGLDIPFIVVTGSISEEVAVECMKQGAADYLLKDRMTRLGQAVTHALDEQRLRLENQQAEKALRDSEARFHVIFEHANDAIHVSNAADEILEVNPRMCELMGYTRAELLRLHVADLQAPEMRGKPGGVITTELAQHGNTTFESLNLHRSGRRTPVEISVARMESEQGDLYVSILRDITERRQAEAALHESEERFRALTEHAPDGIVLVEIDGNFKYVSPAARSIFGYSQNEAINVRPMDFTHPDDLPAVLAALNDLIADPAQVPTLQYRFQHQDGSWRWIESTFSNLLAEPSVEAIIINFRDITERRQAEERLAAERNLIRSLIDTIPELIYAKDGESRFILANMATARQMGVATAAELLGKSDLDFYPPDLARHYLAAEQLVIREGQPILEFEEPAIDAGGQASWQTTTKVPLRNAAGDIIGLVGVTRDITERRRTVAALRESEMRYRAIFDGVRDAILVEASDGRILDANASACEMYGYTHAELLSKTLIDLVPPGQPLLTESIMAGEAHSLHTVESINLRADGARFPIEISGQVASINGEQTLLAVVRDITERQRATELIHLNQVRLQTAQAVGHVGSWEYDFASRKVWGSEESFRIFGLLPADGELDVTELAPFVPEWDLVYQALADMRTRSEKYTFEFTIQPAGDTPPRFVAIMGELIQDAQGQPVKSVGVLQDITARKQAEEQLRNAERFSQATINALSAHLCVLDENGVILTVNQAWHDFAQANPPVPSSQFLGDNYLQVCDNAEGRDEAGSAAFAAGLRAVMRGDLDQFALEYPCDAPWEQRWFTARVTRFLGEGPLRVVVAHEDISARKRAEDALRDKVATLQTLAEIDQEITAAVEPQGILDLVCRRAAELVHAPKSAILTRIAGKMGMTASYGLRDANRVGAEFARTQQAGLMSFDVLETRQSHVLNDITGDNPFMRETVQGEEVRSLTIVPLTVGQEAIGALTVFDTVPRQWQADDLQILALLAGQTAIALEKSRLFEADRARAAQLAMLNEIGQAITSSLDLDLVLVTLLDKVRRATSAEASAVALVDAHSGELVFQQAMGGAAHAVLGLRLPPGEGIVGWVAQHRQSVLVVDATSDTRLHPLENTAGFVTHNLVCVPLIVRDTVTGVIELVNSRRGGFGQDDLQLLESVAAQAAIVIENVRLFETERAGRQRLETLYRIGQAINSTLDADTILDRLTDEAVLATQATHGSALVAHPERRLFERRSLRGYSAEQAAAARRDALPLDRGLNGRAYRLQQPVYIDDVTIDPEYHPLIPATRSELAVPIVRGGQVIGNLDLQSPVVNAFHDIDLQFLQALTDQVAIALENARLFAETHRQMDELTIVTQVALVGAAGRPFDETVARATDALSRLWPEAALGFLFVDESGQALRRHTSYINSAPECDPLENVSFDRGLTGWTARQQRPIRVGDVTTDPRYLQKVSGIRSEMVAPMVVGTQLIGVVNVETPALDAFSGDDLRLLTTMAGQLAVIFEKARLDAVLLEHTAHLEQRVQERTAEIRREQARTQAILDALGEGVVVTDLQGTIQYANQAMELVTGFSVGESLGQNPRLWQSGQTPLEVYEAMWSAVLGGQTWHGEIVNRRKDGELYFASLAVASIPTTANSGEPFAGIVGIQRDITESKHAEFQRETALAALRDSEALYHSLVEVMPQSLCRKDLTGRFTFANHQFLAELKWSLTDLIGKTDFDIHPPALAEKYRRDDQMVISTGQILGVVEERAVTGGNLQYVQTVKAPILNSAGDVSGVQITFWDVSDHMRAEEEMRRALEKERELNNLKSNFVSLTSHEFRTPLTTILSSAEMLEHYGERWTADRKLEHLQRIQTSVKYMTNLLDDILVVAKAEAHRLEFAPVPLDLLKFCRSLVEEFELMDKGNHTLLFNVEVDCAQVNMDEHLLRHILSNLLSNAFKYSPPGSGVQFDLACRAGQAVFRIQDYGLGIPLEDQARLFETFHRAGNVRNIAGTGLGLTIVKRSVDLHGGTIEIMSQVNLGTTVTVSLPIGTPDNG
jgi:PAS domain S-box-containing protein